MKDHTESEFNHFYRGKSHTSPAKEKDVARLQLSYKTSQIHVYTAGRHLSEARRAKDFLAAGSDILKLQGTIDRWAERRLDTRATQEIWEDPEVVNEEPEVAIEEPEVIVNQAVDSDDDMYADGDLWHDIEVMQVDEENSEDDV